MIDVPAQTKNDYGKLIANRGIPIYNHNFYQKWLRFYLDFCHKYNYDFDTRGSLTHFIEKLNEKNQTSQQQKQASHATSLYYELKNTDTLTEPATQNNKAIQKPSVVITKKKEFWEKIYADLDAAIKLRHYSPKTYKTYAGWVRQFQHDLLTLLRQSVYPVPP